MSLLLNEVQHSQTLSSTLDRQGFSESVSGACAGFLKGVGEELARSAGSEVAASEAICGNGPGAQPPETFLTEFYA